jgi:hypothetical protein
MNASFTKLGTVSIFKEYRFCIWKVVGNRVIWGFDSGKCSYYKSDYVKTENNFLLKSHHFLTGTCLTHDW